MAATFSPDGVSWAIVAGVSVSYLGNVFWRMYEFARAAITMYHRVGIMRRWCLNNRNFFSHNSGGEKPKIKVSVWCVVLGLSLLGW